MIPLWKRANACILRFAAANEKERFKELMHELICRRMDKGSLNIWDKNGDTALHVLARDENLEGVQLLLDKGIRRWWKNNRNQIARDVAASSIIKDKIDFNSRNSYLSDDVQMIYPEPTQ